MLHKPKNLTLKPLIVALALSPGLVTADNRLSQIVVSANNTEQTQDTVTANMHVITREEIESRQYQTLTDALTSVPSVTFGLNGGRGHAANVNIRGSNRVLVLLNGIPLNDPSSIANTVNFESLQLDDIERIEIVRGAQSAIWGANAAAGVINIITQKATRQGSAQAGLTLGNNGYRQLNTSLQLVGEDVDATYHFNNTTTDGFSQLKPFKSNEYSFERDGYEQTDVSLGIGLNPTKQQRIETFVKQTTMDADFDDQYATDKLNNKATRQVKSHIRQLSYQLNVNNFRLASQVSETEIERTEGGSFAYLGKQDQKLFQIQRHYRQDDSTQISLVQSNISSDQNDLKVNNTAMSLFNQNLFGKLTLNQALRYDQFNKFTNKTTGRLGVAYAINQHTKLSSNTGTAYTAPSLYQLTYGSTQNLKPEETRDWDIRLDAYGFGIGYFNSVIHDMIEYEAIGNWYDPDFDDYFYNLAGKSKFSGWELDYSRNLNHLNTLLSMQYSQLKAKDDQGLTLARRPKQTASIDLQFYGIHDTKINWHTRYIGTKYDYRNEGTQQIGQYFISDLSANYAVNKQISLHAKVKNLFDEDYTDAVQNANGSIPNIVYANGGRQFFIGIRAAL